MIKINDNLYINKENVVIAQRIGDEYFIRLKSGNLLAITQDIYNQLVGIQQ